MFGGWWGEKNQTAREKKRSAERTGHDWKKKKKHRGVIGDSVEREEHDDDDAKWHGLQENAPFPESIINITNENWCKLQS